jgi:lipopolysaccharide/colanic/teichoic acid biosynthesis glycosyltransferase
MASACERPLEIASVKSIEPVALSAWSQSRAKRVLDLILVVAIMPVFLPLCLVVALAVRVSSRGPILFLQQRVGRAGSLFTIFKFRTMRVASSARRLTGVLNLSEITAVGRVLRAWKLDELPQLVNVLLGDMTLVGPRPRVPEHQVDVLHSRPGVTGPAALIFADEDNLLATLPMDLVEEYCRTLLLPIKHHLDAEYMTRATLASDLSILWQTVLCALGRRHRQLPALTSSGSHGRKSIDRASMLHAFASQLKMTTADLDDLRS